MADIDDLGDTLPIAAGGDAACGPATLVFLEGPNAGAAFPLRGPRVVVGRRAESDLVIASPAVSKEHCVIAADGATFVIQDLGSTNGVLVNGARLASGTTRPLFHGDNVRIADTLAIFRQSGCFKDDTGASRIRIDMDRVRREADTLLHELGLDGSA